MNDNNGEVGAFLAGFIIGALVGAATALILAPQSGSQTRSTLANRGEAWRSTGTERLAQFGSALSEARVRDGDAPDHTFPRIILNKDKGQPAAATSSEDAPDTDQSPEGDSPASG